MPTGIYKRTDEHKKKISSNHSKFWLGKKLSTETRKKLSESHKGKIGYWSGKKRPWLSERNKTINKQRVGEKHWNWRGGITPLNKKIRMSLEYKLWRKSVFERDNYTCVWCNKSNCELNADHIKPFAYYPELRFAIDNGRTLCKLCHLSTETYGKRKSLGKAQARS